MAKLSDHDYYHFRITGWHWPYSFSVNAGIVEDTAYSDHRHLTIETVVLRPQKIKVETVQFIVFPEAGLAEIERSRDEPPPASVGSIDVRQPRPVGCLYMPRDALGLVLQMLIAERFKYLLLNGERMRWGKALIRGYEFTAQYDEGDYPADG